MSFWSLHRNVRFRLIEQFLLNMVGFSVFPFMVIYFSEKFGATITGIIFTANVVVGFVSGFYGGYLTDKFGRRKILIRVEMIRFIAHVIMAIAIYPRFEMPVLVFLMMTVNSICMGFARPAGEAMIVDLSTKENRKYIYNLDYWLWNITVLIGSAVGGFLFKSYRFELIATVAVLSLVSLLMLFFFIKESYTPKTSDPTKEAPNVLKDIINNYKIVITNRTFNLFLLGTFLLLVIQAQTSNYTAVRLAKEIVPQVLFSWHSFTLQVDGIKLFGLLNTVNTVLVVLLGTVVTKVSKNLNTRIVYNFGVLVYAAGFGLIAFLNRPLLMIIIMCVITVAELLIIPETQALMAEIVPDDKRGSYMAINALNQRVITMIGTLSISLGAVLPSVSIGIEIFVVGVSSIYFLGKVRASKLDLSETGDVPVRT